MVRVGIVLACAVGMTAAGACGGDDNTATPGNKDAGGDANTGDAAACTAANHCTMVAAGTPESQIQDLVATAKDGDTITFAAGTFSFTNQMALPTGVKHFSMVGAGIDQTVFDFSGQVAATEGIFAQSVENFRLEGFTVKDTKGNAVRVLGGDGVTLRSLKTYWTGADAGAHGSYGLYPVSSKNVLVEKSIAIGASDTGIYVGQSQNIIVRNNEAYDNVAGIEIENSYFADVHDNDAHDNAGGILVFDLPDLPQQGGHDVHVYNNKIHGNNTPNFAPKGNIVGNVPAGTGFFVLANSHVEVDHNTFDGNGTAQSAIISYLVIDIAVSKPGYNPYPSLVYIHDNTYTGGGNDVDTTRDLGAVLLTAKFPNNHVPEVLFDGFTIYTGHDGGPIPMASA